MLKKPNILHIMVDQQRFDTIAHLNNNVIKTPNLDRLCREGVAFTNAYTPSPVCVAARCSMIYGQYPMNTGCYENGRMPTDGRQSLMDVLTEDGYTTHGIGKCHFTPNSYDLKGFQTRERQEELEVRDLNEEPYFKLLKEKGYDHVCEVFGIRGEMYYIPQPSQLPQELHPSSWIADRAINFIDNQPKEKPWYLYASFIHPHPPFTPPNPWHKLYRAAMMELPNLPQDYENLQTYVNRAQNRYKYRDNGIDNNLLRVMKAYYYACISFVDYQVGKILDMLDEKNLTDDTMIIFTTDHGEHLGDYNCFGKRSFHDSCARIPFIIKQKSRFDGGQICDKPVSLVDILPTVLATTGSSIKSHKPDGVDVYDILNGTNDRKYVFGQLAYDKGNLVAHGVPLPAEYENDKDLWRASMSSYMAVSSEYKYFYSAPDNREFLFDKKQDPKETRNRAGVVFYKDVVKSIRSSLIEHLIFGNETKGIENNGFKAFPKPYFPEDKDTGLLIQDDNIPWINQETPYGTGGAINK